MANILYWTRSDFLQQNRRGGGMRSKTDTMIEAWIDHNIVVSNTLSTPQQKQQVVEKTWIPPEERKTETGEIVETQFKYDVILIELMGLLDSPRDACEDRIRQLAAYPAPKIVYGSDSEIFRWYGFELEALRPVTDVWIANCEWQDSYFRDFDLPVAGIVYEPINTNLFRPNEDINPVIIAGGQVSYGKQSDFFIELFAKLKETDTGIYKTAYVGGADLWGKPKPEDLNLQKGIKAVVDIFHGTVSQSKVAEAIGAAAIGVLNPHYETCNRFDMELMSSGKARVCGRHIIYDERPNAGRFEGVSECIEILETLTDGWSELPDAKYGKAARTHAIKNFSFESTQDQLNQILRGVL